MPKAERGQRARSRGPALGRAGSPSGPMRIAKALARAGLCSRRQAERWIGAGGVAFKGAVLEGPAGDAPRANHIRAAGRPLPAADPPRLWRYHKPKGRVTTHSDPQGRPTVFEALSEQMPRVISVGRL